MTYSGILDTTELPSLLACCFSLAVTTADSYQQGNLQDVINSNTVNGSHFPEHEMMRYFKGTCLAVRAMHDYRTVMNNNSNSIGTLSTPGLSQPEDGPSARRDDDDDDEPDIELPEPEGDLEGGYSYGGASMPLVSRNKKRSRGKDRGVDVLFDGDDELERLNAHPAPEIGPSDHLPPGTKTELVPYAHRDIKPGNIMLSDEGEPILMDFGSTVLARMRIDTRQQALTQQVCAAWVSCG
jgi:serine/threonine kinase 16